MKLLLLVSGNNNYHLTFACILYFLKAMLVIWMCTLEVSSIQLDEVSQSGERTARASGIRFGHGPVVSGNANPFNFLKKNPLPGGLK